MRSKRRKTSYPGVFLLSKRVYQIDGEARDPRTGRVKQVERVLHGVTARQASRIRNEELDKIRSGETDRPKEKQRLRDSCASWLKLKAPSLDWRTAETYTYALAHVCGEPGLQVDVKKGGLGDFFEGVFTREDVQKWVNSQLGFGYSPETIKGWLRVFRTMATDQGWANPAFRISLPETPDRGANMLTESQLTTFLSVMLRDSPQHYALMVFLASTGLRFCHASALRFDDIDEEKQVVHIRRKQVRGKVGAVSRKKKAPKLIPVDGEILKVLRWHRQRLLTDQHPGLAAGWVFPSKSGKLFEGTASLSKARTSALKAAGIKERFTVHGFRRSFNDLSRRASIDPLVIKSITGHVTEDMREHYSTVDLSEKARAISAVAKRLGFSPETVDQTVDEGPRA